MKLEVESYPHICKFFQRMVVHDVSCKYFRQSLQATQDNVKNDHLEPSTTGTVNVEDGLKNAF